LSGGALVAAVVIPAYLVMLLRLRH
jgi:hypothetical protein